ncbi:MAG: hypothetical protein ABEK02_04480 [Haloquadratum sp.]
MAAALPEPLVLAAAKDALYPGEGAESEQYTVTETQFTRDAWGEWQIPAEIRNRLAPFNSVRLSTGEPDLIGVGTPTVEVFDLDTATTPVVAVEAKGDNDAPEKADVARGIEQAHAHLAEVNIGYVAAPIQSITETARSMARDLNVGVIGVEARDRATLVEPARVTGAGEFSTGIDAIRFRASTHRLTEGSFPVNHPKNFLGYALALAADADTATAYAEHVIRAVSGGRRGAILLGLVEDCPDGEKLTHRGAEVVRFARRRHGRLDAALEQFDDWTGKRARFPSYAPRWAQLARSITMQYEPAQLVVDALERLHREGIQTATLPAVVRESCRLNQPLAVEVFFSEGRRDDVLVSDGSIDESHLRDPAVYKSGVYFQFKSQLYHVGVLTSAGTDDADAALEDAWELEQPVR